ncbi:hypothetical protein HMPREF1553_01862 [Porphyromonas gingivalis F0568]|nr:hypothetical protein HMPREF1553_01862 [Porphyromonas gingivalis F0568]
MGILRFLFEECERVVVGSCRWRRNGTKISVETSMNQSSRMGM